MPKPTQAPATQREAWQPPGDSIPKEKAVQPVLPQAVQDFVSQPQTVSLGQLIDLALLTNPRTKITWTKTRSAYASIQIERAAYYPRIDGGAQYKGERRTSLPGQADSVSDYDRKGAFAIMDYLLFDFGGREARIDEQRLGLISTNFAHNAAIQEVILQIQQGYYQYVALRALERTQQDTLSEVETSLTAAKDRRSAGVGTLADELQAQTSVSRARLGLVSTQGRIKAVRGAVLMTAGLPPSAPVDVESLPIETFRTEDVVEDVQSMVDRAAAANPQLLSAQARAEASMYRLESVRKKGWPVIRGVGRFDDWIGEGSGRDDYSAAVSVTFPIFTGFSYTNEVIRASAEAEAAKAEYDLLNQNRSVAIWADFYAHQTAGEQIKSSDALFASASQSYEVALGRYKEGVGSIIDLLSAQANLSLARSAQVEARAEWLISLAQLRYDLGELDNRGVSQTESAQ